MACVCVLCLLSMYAHLSCLWTTKEHELWRDTSANATSKALTCNRNRLLDIQSNYQSTRKHFPSLVSFLMSEWLLLYTHYSHWNLHSLLGYVNEFIFKLHYRVHCELTSVSFLTSGMYLLQSWPDWLFLYFFTWKYANYRFRLKMYMMSLLQFFFLCGRLITVLFYFFL